MDYNVESNPEMNQQPQHLNTGPVGKFDKFGGKKRVLMIVGAVVATLLVAGLLFFLLTGKDDKKDSGKQDSSQTAEESDEPTMPEASQLQTYKSETLNIEIAYRKDWTLKEDAAKKLLTITSPKVTLESGKTPFVVKFGLGISEAAQENLDNASAMRDSLLIGYDAPTEAQRHYTNVTYAGPPGENSSFEFFIVTGSIAYKANTPFAGGVVVNSGDFLIAGGFGADVQNQLTFEQIDPSELDGYAVYEQALAIVKSLKVY